MTTREYMAKRLREFRSVSGLSVDEVGEKIGKSGKTISAWEVGRGQPDADKLVEICKLYGVRISDFYDDGVGDGLTHDERTLLTTFRKLNVDGRGIALSVLDALDLSGKYTDKEGNNL